jgi:PAS domain S-box-containing protein
MNNERRIAEETLRESEQRWRSLTEALPQLVWSATPDGACDYFSPQWTEYTGVAESELLGWRWMDVLHPGDRQSTRQIWTDSVAGRRAYDVEYRVRRHDGTHSWFKTRGVPIRDSNGNIVKWFGSCTDINDRKRAEEALRESEQELRKARDELEMKVMERTAELQRTMAELTHMNRVATAGVLSASIAHEVNQPIAATATNAQSALRFLDGRPPNLEEVRLALADIITDSDRAGRIIGRIRDLIKKAPPHQDRLDINEAIREVIVLTHGEAMKTGVSVKTELAEGLSLIQGDRVQLQQVILNLIINAVEAMSGVGVGSRELLIRTCNAEPDGVHVAVRDSGPGLAPTNLERLFEAFYTTKPSGLGMGLSICRSIIEAHGGRLWATANVPQGAIFQFTLTQEKLFK